MIRISKSNKFDELLDSPIAGAKSYSELTNNIQITVWPEFVDNKISANGDIFIWAYHVRIENRNNEAVQLNKRYWRIIDEDGGVQEVNGEGVVGEQPIIAPNSSYQYSSGVHLRNPSGIMSGKYFMKKISNNEVLEVKIPAFSLDVPNITGVVN
jgi:ApaG protein